MKITDAVLLAVVLVFTLDKVNRNTRNLSGLCYGLFAFATLNLIVEILQFEAPVTHSTVLFHFGGAVVSIVSLWKEHLHRAKPTFRHIGFFR